MAVAAELDEGFCRRPSQIGVCGEGVGADETLEVDISSSSVGHRIIDVETTVVGEAAHGLPGKNHILASTNFLRQRVRKPQTRHVYQVIYVLAWRRSSLG